MTDNEKLAAQLGLVVVGLGALFYLAHKSLDGILETFGFKKKPTVEDQSTTTVADAPVNPSQEPMTPGTIQGTIISPIDNDTVRREGFAGNYYPVQISIKNGSHVDSQIHAQIIAHEHYKLASDADHTENVPSFVLPAGQAVVQTIRVQAADADTVELFSPRVTAQLWVNGTMEHEVTFTRD